jgi:hypothetical protein
VAVLSVLAVLAASLPFIASLSSGRFDLPTTGAPESLGASTTHAAGGSRTLWLGAPDALPVQGWSVVPGLAAATSTNGRPGGDTLFSPPVAGAFATVLSDLHEALNGGTVRLGQLLAPAGISQIVVVDAASPQIPGIQQSRLEPPPGALATALNRQVDLAEASNSAGVTVYDNTLFHGVIAERAAPLSSHTSASNPSSALGWSGVLSTLGRDGSINAGTVFAGLSPASAFSLQVNGHTVGRASAFGWAARYDAPAGVAKLTLRQLPLNAVIAALTLALWLLLGLGFGTLEILEGALHRRRQRNASLVPRREGDE